VYILRSVFGGSQYKILSGGRVKAAGGSVEPYYRCAEPVITLGSQGSFETYENFRHLIEKPPFPLLLAYFPYDRQVISRRLRGAGLYRHLRTDQGPGGNFLAHSTVEEDGLLSYEIIGDEGYALPEYSVTKQLEDNNLSQALFPLVEQIQKKFQKNCYRETGFFL
jgi:hypothetical protein